MPERKRLYPLKFTHNFKKKIWGGRRLEQFPDLNLPEGQPIGESWELCDRKNDVSIVTNGVYKNSTLKQIIDCLSVDLLGTEKKLDPWDRFPVLIKLLDISNLLSVQVHPDNDTALKFKETDPGKTEMWYVMHADEGTKIVYGCKQELKDLNTSFTKEHEKYLNFVPVKTGDVVFIPPGKVHALLGGTIILEIQQNSDVTYRLYDWDRTGLSGKPRNLHLDKGLQSIKTNNCEKPFLNIFDMKDDCFKLASCESFKAIYRAVKTKLTCSTDKKSYQIVYVIEGKGSLVYGKNKENKTDLNLADVILLPAALGSYDILPDDTLKLIYIE